jgi:hypothetical protein
MWRHWTKFVCVLNIDKLGWVYDEGFAITQTHYINAILSLKKSWFSLSRKYKYKIYYSSPIRSEAFVLGEFSPLGNKKWAGESNKGKFGNFPKKIRHILRRKKARSRQIYTVCYCRSPELARIPKKIYLFSGTVANYCWGS